MTKKILNIDEEKLIESEIENFETETSSELVIAIFKSSDPYAGAKLKFSICNSFILSFLLNYFFILDTTILLIITFGLIGIVEIFNQYFDCYKFFITKFEKKREVNEKAMHLFYEKNIFHTTHQMGILVFLSIMERKIEIVVDEKAKHVYTQNNLDHFVQLIGHHFKNKDYKNGISEVLVQMKTIANSKLEKSNHGQNQLSNKIIWG